MERYEENGGKGSDTDGKGGGCRERGRVERKRRSDKREASTMRANKENPNGGINHCPTYPSSL